MKSEFPPMPWEYNTREEFEKAVYEHIKEAFGEEPLSPLQEQTEEAPDNKNQG